MSPGPCQASRPNADHITGLKGSHHAALKGVKAFSKAGVRHREDAARAPRSKPSIRCQEWLQSEVPDLVAGGSDP